MANPKLPWTLPCGCLLEQDPQSERRVLVTHCDAHYSEVRDALLQRVLYGSAKGTDGSP